MPTSNSKHRKVSYDSYRSAVQSYRDLASLLEQFQSLQPHTAEQANISSFMELHEQNKATLNICSKPDYKVNHEQILSNLLLVLNDVVEAKAPGSVSNLKAQFSERRINATRPGFILRCANWLFTTFLFGRKESSVISHYQMRSLKYEQMRRISRCIEQLIEEYNGLRNPAASRRHQEPTHSVSPALGALGRRASVPLRVNAAIRYWVFHPERRASEPLSRSAKSSHTHSSLPLAPYSRPY